MKSNRYFVDGSHVVFTKIKVIFDGIEVDGLLFHDCNDEFCNGDCITSEIDYLPEDEYEAKTIIENCYWISYWHRDPSSGIYISEEP